ncbi:MAG TPA: LytTR family DNA-binding domain-containing protein [Chitinophagaceae bacterium]|nr:LytTR family DNA-binding domain-containing protein [Chitinophagaceae bacterium]
MNIRCIAIDDEPLALVVVEKMLQPYPMMRLVAAFDDAISAMEFLRDHPVDLLFLDINMPDISGLELVKALPDKPMIIFVTAHKNFAVESYELDALDYLVKPIRSDRFDKAVRKAIEFYSYKNAKRQDDEVIFIRAEYQLVKINLGEIEYIESMEDYCRIHLVNARPVMTLTTLKSILEKLPHEKFSRIHRSYIIAHDKIKSIANRKIHLPSAELPVGASYVHFLNNISKK